MPAVLGLTEQIKPPQLAARGGCWFESGDLEVYLGVENNFIPARKAHPAFIVDDPFGNRIELIEPHEK